MYIINTVIGVGSGAGTGHPLRCCNYLGFQFHRFHFWGG